MCDSRFFWNPTVAKFHVPGHPLDPRRLLATLDLLEEAGLLRKEESAAASPATDDELTLFHRKGYVELVKALSSTSPEPHFLEEAREHGLGTQDNPIFPGMHEAYAAAAGLTLAAARAVASGEVLHAMNIAGGLHHAHRERASGFCVYNDIALALTWLTRQAGFRVLYVDIDAHHGDGVQFAFYDDPSVCTLSLHETGRFLFPGTGEIGERGVGRGRGFSLNLPLEPFTEDGAFLAALEELVPAVAAFFGPDIVVSQHGCDGHALDPLSDLSLTTAAYEGAARLIHRVAHEHAGGRWLALGGGGYEVSVVARCLALLWAEMSGRPLPPALPESWRRKWGEAMLPKGFGDPPGAFEPIPRRAEIERETARRLRRVKLLSLPVLVQRAYSLSPQAAQPPALLPHLGLLPRQGRLETRKGRLLLRAWVLPEDLPSLQPCPDLAILPRREGDRRALLRRLATRRDLGVVAAEAPTGETVALLLFANPEGRFAGVPGVYEMLAVEVAGSWQGQGVGTGLLSFALEDPFLDQVVLITYAVRWHLETARRGLASPETGKALRRALARAGFEEVPTDDPEVATDPANALLVRYGPSVPPEVRQAFAARLFARD